MTADGAPRAILALDGGGIRGAFTLGVLGELETILAEETGRGEDFVLSDYFDFIGGTSTGAIIATGLALGWTVDSLKERYRRLGSAIFGKRRLGPLRAWSKYPPGPLRRHLKHEFGNRTFGDPDLRTVLMIVIHNRTTDSPWPLVNNPKALFGAPQGHNLEQRLADLLAASTAAPSFFPSVRLDFGEGAQECVDGGVTAHNNPALQMFLTATLPEYRMEWATGPDKLQLISIGTGYSPARLTDLSRVRRHIIYVASNMPWGLMFAAAYHNDVVCRALADTKFGPHLDAELNDMVGGGLQPKLFTYARYNVELSDDTLAQFKINVPARQLIKIDTVDHVETLMQLGTSYARLHLKPEHVAGFKGQLPRTRPKARRSALRRMPRTS
jgi:patatin-like phospholipase/acyl hydrolase